MQRKVDDRLIKTTIHIFREQWLWLRRATERGWVDSVSDGVRVGLTLLRQELETRHGKIKIEE